MSRPGDFRRASSATKDGSQAIVLGLVAIVLGTWLFFAYRQGDVRNEPLNGHPRPTVSDESGPTTMQPQGVPRDGPSPPTYPNVFDEGEMVDGAASGAEPSR